MKKTLFIFLVITTLFTFTISAKDEDKVKIHGVITYFDGTPVNGAEVSLRQNNFGTAYETLTNEKGVYELLVKQGRYLALFACKDYGEKNLEFWAWNIFAFEDLEINARIDKLEIYGINAFRVQGAMRNSVCIYFRPMSLTRSKEWRKNEENKDKPITDIAPRFSKEDIEVKINSETVEVLQINKVHEAVPEGRAIIGYLVHTTLPTNWRDSDQLCFWITLTDKERGEKGEGCLFWKREWFNQY